MRYHSRIYEGAKQLRSEGKTYSEIRALLKTSIPKSTLSTWCHDVALPKWFEERVKLLNESNLSKAQKMAWVSNKHIQEKRRQTALQKNLYLASKISDKDVGKMLLAMLYLGEGAKWKSHRGLHLGSSDPEIVQIYMRLLHHCYGIKTSQLRASICYRADQNLMELKKCWSKITRIPLQNFYPTKPDARTIGKTTLRKDYRGVCALTCAGTDIQLELAAISTIILSGLKFELRSR